MPSLIRRGRTRLASERAIRPWLSVWSPADASLDRKLRPALKRGSRGTVLDVGCGESPYRRSILDMGCSYLGTDLDGEGRTIDFRADASRLPLRDESVDTVLCSEVLEHVPHPEQALREAIRVLRAGGYLFVSVPFLSRIHEAPNDYYRFSSFALRRLSADSGLESVEVYECGSVFTFLAHQVSSIVVPVAFGVAPWFGRAAALLCGLLLTAPALVLDRLPGLAKTFPAGYLVVARKPESVHGQSVSAPTVTR